MTRAYNTKYGDLYDALESMEIGDCLPWRGIPKGSVRRIKAAVWERINKHTTLTIRSLTHNGVTYFIRVE